MVLTLAFAAMLVITVSLVTIHMANADSLPSSPVQPNSNQDAIKSMITDGLQLANQSSQQWQQKHNLSNDQQEQPITANGLNSHSNNKFDNHSPSVLAELPF
jgi:Spy/CpxP family protein refolding chaperone